MADQPDNEVLEEDGVEIESGDDNLIKRPFDPEKIKVQSSSLLVAQLVNRMSHGEIMTPTFQRRAGIWNVQRKSRLIESLLLRIPIPVFYFAADDDENWSVVDGLQRSTTIRDFVANDFALRGLEYLDKFENKFHRELPRPMQRRIDETPLVVNVIQPGTPDEVTFNIFSRINTGGMTLRGQEIRHALHNGPVLEFLREMAESKEFLVATSASVSPQRMADRECVLRFVAFHLRAWSTYSTGDDLDRWLGDAMRAVNDMSEEGRRNLRTSFNHAMAVAARIFGEYAFRKRYGVDDERRRPVNKALFEAWSVGLANRSIEEHKKLMNRRKMVAEQFFGLMCSDDFEGAVSTATGTASKVHLRFGAVADLIEDCL
ncbi:MAG: DUF262 domain-containing protein [Gammaproteobacteria bacterium]|nr:DUF262 domain-containing protein [Gammaproteobacteria bacterium]MDE0226398.1 DUF262 domain-containing protein [Gammaproteobacteria bacterium]